MKLFKFKDLTCESNFPHLFQIVEGNKIWCAAADKLNDDQEFHFSIDYTPTNNTEKLLSQMIGKLGKSQYPPELVAKYAIQENRIEDNVKPQLSNMISACRNSIGVTSFSSVGTGNELWQEYGGKGNGAVVEFEIPDELIGYRFHIVEYKKVKKFHVDLFLRSQISSDYSFFENVLCTKTLKWKSEQEIRFLGRTPNVNITLDTTVKSLTIGNKVSDCHKNKLISVCEQKGISINLK